MIRYVILIIVALATCLAGNTQSITIVPAYQVGDSLEYVATCTLKTTHDNDSLLCITITQPRIYVESRNDKGFILSTANKLRSYESETTDSLISKELVPR